jgi:predicted Zn-dependent protease
MRLPFSRAAARDWRHVVAATAMCLSVQVNGHEAAPAPAPAALALPALGDASAQDLSPAAERRLGDRIMRSILGDPAIVDDPLVREYIDQLWMSLLQAARARGEITAELDQVHAWEPFLVKDRSVNAFALPGGYIGIHLGLLAVTRTPDELASVLAHELSHVTQRHIARMISQQSRTSWVGVASLLLGVLAASSNPAAAQAMIYGGQAATIQGQLNFSRDMEREADRVGFGILGDAGFRVSGMALMFENLQQASRLNDDGSFPYLRTHPLTTERIADARARVGSGGWDVASALRPDASSMWAWHALMSGRARVLMDTRSVALESLTGLQARADQSPLESVAAHFTRAVAWQRSGNPAAAQQALNEAAQWLPRLPTAQRVVAERVLALTAAEGLLQRQQVDEAQRVLQSVLPAGRPSVVRVEARPELLLGARLALAWPEGSPRPAAAWSDAATRLQTHVSVHPHDAAAWALLSSLWQRLDQPIRAVRADAEAAAALGDLAGAIDRAEGARRRFRQPDAAAFIELSVLDSRLKAWQRQWQEDVRDDGSR